MGRIFYLFPCDNKWYLGLGARGKKVNHLLTEFANVTAYLNVVFTAMEFFLQNVRSSQFVLKLCMATSYDSNFRT